MSKRGRRKSSDDTNEDDPEREEKIPKLEGVGANTAELESRKDPEEEWGSSRDAIDINLPDLIHTSVNDLTPELQAAAEAFLDELDEAFPDETDSDASLDVSHTSEPFVESDTNNPDCGDREDVAEAIPGDTVENEIAAGSEREIMADSNAPSWRTTSETTVSDKERCEDQAGNPVVDVTSATKLTENNEGNGASTSKPGSEPKPNEKPKRRETRPKASDLKINKKNYAETRRQRNIIERSTPPPQVESDQDSDTEGKPKREISEKWEEEVRERRPLKRPPKKSK